LRKNALDFGNNSHHTGRMDKETALKNLYQRCFDARLPMYALCDIAGVSPSTPSRWKAKPATINPRVLGKLEMALDMIDAGIIKKGA